MLGLTIVVLALALAPALSEQVNTARNNTWVQNNTALGGGNVTIVGLDCDNSSISDFNKATCVATDLSLFYYIGALIFIGGVVVTARLVMRE